MKKQDMTNHLLIKTFQQLIFSIIYIMGSVNGAIQAKEEEPP